MRRDGPVIYVGSIWRFGSPCQQANSRHAARFCHCAVAISRADRGAIASPAKEKFLLELRPRGLRWNS
jgi:hypothetical protein